MRNKKIVLLAVLAILIIVSSICFMSCNKNKDNGPFNWTKVLNSNYLAKAREIEYSQIDEISIPLMETGKTYMTLGDANMYSENNDFVIFAEDAAEINSFIIYDMATNTSAKFEIGQNVDPYNLEFATTGNGIIVVNDDNDGIYWLTNKAAEKIKDATAKIEIDQGSNDVYIVDDVIYVYDNGTVVRSSVKPQQNQQGYYTRYNNGYFQVQDDNNFYIYNKTGKLTAKLEKQIFKPNVDPAATTLPNGDLFVTYLIQLEFSPIVVPTSADYDVAIVNGQNTRYFSKEQYILSAETGAITAVNYDFIPYMAASAETAADTFNAKLNDGYIGILGAMPIVDKYVTGANMALDYYAITKDGAFEKINDFDVVTSNIANRAILVDTDTFAVINYVDDLITFVNKKGEYVGSFYNFDNYGMKYVIVDNNAYNLDGSAKYTLLKDKEQFKNEYDTYFTVYNSDTKAVKIFYKNNEVKAFECDDYDNVDATENYIIHSKAGSTDIYKVDGTFVKTINTNFVDSKHTLSGTIALGADGKWYLAK